jgi:hypothetical protein
MTDAATGINLWISIFGLALMPLLSAALRRHEVGGSIDRAVIIAGCTAAVMLVASLCPRTYRLSPRAVVAVGFLAALTAAAASLVDSALL